MYGKNKGLLAIRSIIIKYVYKVEFLHSQTFQIVPDFSTLKIFTLT